MLPVLISKKETVSLFEQKNESKQILYVVKLGSPTVTARHAIRQEEEEAQTLAN